MRLIDVATHHFLSITVQQATPLECGSNFRSFLGISSPNSADMSFSGILSQYKLPCVDDCETFSEHSETDLEVTSVCSSESETTADGLAPIKLPKALRGYIRFADATQNALQEHAYHQPFSLIVVLVAPHHVKNTNIRLFIVPCHNTQHSTIQFNHRVVWRYHSYSKA